VHISGGSCDHCRGVYVPIKGVSSAHYRGVLCRATPTPVRLSLVVAGVEEDAASVYGYTGTLYANSQEVSGQASDSGRRMRRVCVGIL